MLCLKFTMVKKAPTDREHKPGANKAVGSTSMAKKVYRGILRSAIDSISWFTVDAEKKALEDKVEALSATLENSAAVKYMADRIAGMSNGPRTRAEDAWPISKKKGFVDNTLASTLSLQHSLTSTLSLQHSHFNTLTSTLSLQHSLTSTI